MAYDPVEYCETLGLYNKDAGLTLRAVSDKLPIVATMDYSAICNINSLHIDTLVSLPHLTRYGVVHGNVRDIPPAIKQLTGLTRLQIQDQQVAIVPNEIGSLTNLETLILAGNAIQTLPDSIGNLSRLAVLHIYDNRLTTLPDSIGKLAALRILDARTNRLTTLPDSIASLNTTLRKLYLGGNPISKKEQARIRSMLPSVDIYFTTTEARTGG